MRPLICFDWDGTLADSMELCRAECRSTLRIMGLPPVSQEALSACNGPTNYEASHILGVPDERRDEYMAIRAAENLRLCPSENRLFPGIRELLEELSRRADLAVVSNGQLPYIRLGIEIFGVAPYVSGVRGYTPGLTKAQLLRDLLEERRPERAVMVGDRLGDLEAGRACGLPTVAAGYGYGDDEEYAHADHVCRSVEELRAYLAAWAEG